MPLAFPRYCGGSVLSVWNLVRFFPLPEVSVSSAQSLGTYSQFYHFLLVKLNVSATNNKPRGLWLLLPKVERKFFTHFRGKRRGERGVSVSQCHLNLLQIVTWKINLYSDNNWNFCNLSPLLTAVASDQFSVKIQLNVSIICHVIFRKKWRCVLKR